MRAINEAFSQGHLGTLPPRFQDRLEQQVAWLLRAANITDHVAVNDGVSATRLDVVVTTPNYQSITGCGRGNAIYDPALDAIFIDYALIVPEDLYLLGEESVLSMISVENTDVHFAYQNFILAHELGHRSDLHSDYIPTAFFHYSAAADGMATKEQEAAADRFAVKILLNGILRIGPPPFQEQFDFLDAINLDVKSVTPEDHAASEIVGAVFLLSTALLFSASPYSPFHFDENHPSFVDRSLAALGQVADLDVTERTAAHFAFFSETIRSLQRLPLHTFRELYFHTPVFRIDILENRLRFGIHHLPYHDMAEIYFVATNELLDIRSDGYLLSGRKPAAVYSNSSALIYPRVQYPYEAVDWLRAAFDESSEPGPTYSDLRSPDVPDSLGADALAISDQRYSMGNAVSQEFVVRHGLLLREAIKIENDWWVPAFPPYGAGEPERWALWQISKDSIPTEQFSGQLSISKVGIHADGGFLRDHDPRLGGISALRDGRILIWFEDDAMYLLDTTSNRSTLLFAPVFAGLQILEIQSNELLIWMKNGLKAYLADLNKI